MTTLIHLCRKDFSFAKYDLIGAWAVFLVAAMLPRFLTSALAEAAAAVLGLLLIVQYFQIFAASLKILRADSFHGGNAFIGTRPVTKTLLWFSKIASIATFVLVPWLLAKMIGILTLGVHLSTSDWVIFVCEEMLVFGTIAALALVVGTHTRNFVRTSLLTIALVAGVLWLAASIFNRSGGLHFITEARHLKASQWLVAQTLITASGLALSWLWIARRSMRASTAAGVLGFAAIALIAKSWDINYVERLAAAGTTTAPRLSWTGEPRISESGRNNVRFTTVVRGVELEDVPDGWTGFPSGVISEAHFADGTKLIGHATNSRTYGDATRALLPTMDIPINPDLAVPMQGLSTWFECEQSRVREMAGAPCTIRGAAMVELHEPIVLANLPAISGASAASGRLHCRIERLEANPEGVILLDISFAGASLRTHGDWGNLHDEIELLIVNPRTGNHTSIGHQSGTTSSTFGWSFLQRRLPIKGSAVDDTVDYRGFLKDARVYLIGRRYRGTVRVPFEMPEVRLERER